MQPNGDGVLAAGNYAGAVSAYSRGAELAAADGYPGLAAINLAVCVNTSMLGGGEAEGAIAKAEEALDLARQSGMHVAIVISLNSLRSPWLTATRHGPGPSSMKASSAAPRLAGRAERASSPRAW